MEAFGRVLDEPSSTVRQQPCRTYSIHWLGLPKVEEPSWYSNQNQRYTYNGFVSVRLADNDEVAYPKLKPEPTPYSSDPRARLAVEGVLSGSWIHFDFILPLRHPRLFRRPAPNLRLQLELQAQPERFDIVEQCARPMVLVVTGWSLYDGDYAEHGRNVPFSKLPFRP